MASFRSRILPLDRLTLRLRKRVCIKQSENTSIRSSFCPIISQQENVCVVCTGSEDSCVYLYDMERDDKPLVNRLQGHPSTVIDCCFNYDESLLASGDKQVNLMIETTKQLSLKIQLKGNGYCLET